MSRKNSSLFMIAGMIVSWSVYYAISKVVVSKAGSAFLAGFSLRAVTLVFLTAQLALSGNLKRLFCHGKTTRLLILIGVLGFTQDICANLGYAGGSLSTGTVLLKTDVLMANLATVIVYKKLLYKSDWLATAVMLAGVFLVLGLDPSSMSFNITDLFFILSAAALTGNAFAVKGVQGAAAIDSEIISYYNNTIVMLLSLAGALAGGAFTPAALSGLRDVWYLCLLGGLAQTGVYFFYYRNLSRHEVWIVKLYLLLIPILSCVIGVAFLNEKITPLKLLGMLIVLAGAAIILLRDKINAGEK